MTLAALHVTKCRLCGQPPAGPAGLCSDCSRALARAQGASATRNGSAFGARKPRIVERIVLTSPVDPEPARSPKKARAALWATLGVIAVVGVLAVTASLSPPRPVEVKVTERAARVVPQMLEPAAESEPDEAPAVPPRKAAEPPSLPSLPKDSTRAMPPRAARSAAPRAVSEAKTIDDASRINAAAQPQQAEPPVQQARASVAPSPSAADDAQSLATLLERCSDEKFLAGVICEQKVRLRYCEGKWGQVPQCTKKPHVD
jgi:hypothetical protein